MQGLLISFKVTNHYTVTTFSYLANATKEMDWTFPNVRERVAAHFARCVVVLTTAVSIDSRLLE
jgi:hypothetical protein